MLFAFELVSAVGISNRNGERIAAGLLDEFHRFFRHGIMTAHGMRAAFFTFVKLRADEVAEFGFDGAIIFVRVFDDFLGDLDILLKWFVRSVNHHAGETFVNALLAQLERVAVVEVNGNRDIAQANGGLNEFFEINRVGVGTRTLGNLQHQRGFFLFASLNDGLDEFHIVDVESAEGVFAFECFGEQVFSMCQWHKFIVLGFRTNSPCCSIAADYKKSPPKENQKIQPVFVQIRK